MLKRFAELLKPDPAQQEKLAFVKKLAASGAFVDAITSITDPDRGVKLDADLANDAMRHLTNKWLTEFGRSVYPNIDEFEINKDMVVLHPDHDQREEHSRFNLRQLRAWVDTQRHHNNI